MPAVNKYAAILSIMALVCCGCFHIPTHQLVVGMELNYPPFEMIDPEGKPAGLSVDMAEALGRFLGRTVKIENIPFDGLIPALRFCPRCGRSRCFPGRRANPRMRRAGTSFHRALFGSVSEVPDKGSQILKSGRPFTRYPLLMDKAFIEVHEKATVVLSVQLVIRGGSTSQISLPCKRSPSAIFGWNEPFFHKIGPSRWR